jgi:predicted nucleotide-binding protein (sugar kinase/HSP70/actin superfamily)
MSTIELKEILKSKIDQIDDAVFLSALNTILENKSKSNQSFNQDLQKLVILSEEQKKEILNSQKEYLEGNYIENDVLNEEMDKWLREE